MSGFSQRTAEGVEALPEPYVTIQQHTIFREQFSSLENYANFLYKTVSQESRQRQRESKLEEKVVTLTRRENDLRIKLEEKEKMVEELEKRLTCCVCFSAPREVAILPCGHVVLCQGCSVRLWEMDQNMWPTCPYCRGDRNDTIDVYIP